MSPASRDRLARRGICRGIDVLYITGIARGQGRNHPLRFAREAAAIIGLDIAGIKAMPV